MTTHAPILVALRGGPMDGKVVETWPGANTVEVPAATMWGGQRLHVYRIDVVAPEIVEAIYERTR